MSQVTKLQDKPHYTGHRKRLKQRFIESKKGSLPDYEILEILLFSANPRGDVKPMAKDLISQFGSFAKVLTAPQGELLKCKGMNESALASIKVVQEAAERLLKDSLVKNPIVDSWSKLVNYCRASMGHLSSEQFRVLYLNTKNRIISDELQEVGTVNHTPVYTREIVKRSLQLDAAGIMLVHNHPSGDVTPSNADIKVTIEINKACQCMGIKLYDHMIISANDHFSFKSNGLF